MPALLRWAVSGTVTLRVVPCRVRSPVVETGTGPVLSTVAPRSIGLVSLKVAVGYLAVSMIRPWNWASRRDWSLATLVRSTLNVAVVTTDFAIVMAPVIAVVRPTAVLPWPASVSPTR
ncbi:MAG TPA: hypothetical protein VHN80_02685 [Kineosporiaceae bacterium]|nr:hypothetical protein [Kineosporiaceae bacterium]